MKKYQAILSGGELRWLTQTAGIELSSVTGSSIHMNNDASSHQSYATIFLQYTSTNCLAITSQLNETSDLEHFWEISVQKQKQPQPIIFEVGHSDEKVSSNATDIKVNSIVNGIFVYNKEIKTEHEHILYDHAIVFDLTDSKKLCISVLESYCGVVITSDEQKIKEILPDCTLRYNFTL